MPTYTVSAQDEGLRLDQYLARSMPDYSRSYLQKLIDADQVLRNDAPASRKDRVSAGDRVAVTIPPLPDPTPQAEPFVYPVLYDDPHLIAIAKPADLIVHPGAGTANQGTLVNALLDYDPAAFGSMLDDELRPGIVHRLDKDTSGVIVVAKSPQARARLSAAFKDRRTQKVYLAIVQGIPDPPAGTIDAPIGRHPSQRHRMTVLPEGRQARSHYQVLSANPDAPDGPAALVAVRIETGRTHQIRVHLTHIGHPLLGDAVYGRRVSERAPRQMLHAWRLTVPHPEDGRDMAFSAEPPADFQDCLRAQGLTLPADPELAW